MDEGALREHIPRREQNHDQAQWIAFYKVTKASFHLILEGFSFRSAVFLRCE